METLLLVHSPLLGPSSWYPLAAVATAAGNVAIVPDLTSVADLSGRWSAAFIALAAADCPAEGDVVFVGHSGAGVYLPGIARTVGMERASFVFVDAVVPPPSGAMVPGDRIASLLDSHTEGGFLAPWLDWWPKTVLETILPSDADLTTLRSDSPRIPRALYSEAVAVPAGWQSRRCRYVRTSEAYRAEHQHAVAQGWDHALVEGTHLSIVTEPKTVFEQILPMP